MPVYNWLCDNTTSPLKSNPLAIWVLFRFGGVGRCSDRPSPSRTSCPLQTLPAIHMPIRFAHGLPLRQPSCRMTQWRPLPSFGCLGPPPDPTPVGHCLPPPRLPRRNGFPAAYRVRPATVLGSGSRTFRRSVARRSGGAVLGSVAAWRKLPGQSCSCGLKFSWVDCITASTGRMPSLAWGGSPGHLTARSTCIGRNPSGSHGWIPASIMAFPDREGSGRGAQMERRGSLSNRIGRNLDFQAVQS